MFNLSPKILALDFDGVICDGLKEYFQTTQLAYNQIWDRDSQTNTSDLASSFYRLRPAIETGWEMPVLLRALVLGYTEENILQEWSDISRTLVESEKLEPKNLANKVDNIRDICIESDLEAWLNLHGFYPGIIEKLSEISRSATKIYIVTTKEGRFVKKLLSKQGIELPESSLIGKESKKPKHQTLREILATHNETPENLWFVEDRLKTLNSIEQQSDLQGVGLYLAEWGYNTDSAKKSATLNPRIHLLSLDRFVGDFSSWNEEK
jgi:phosphoglycolate phosphatase-like HAD superfamily hydrolase